MLTVSEQPVMDIREELRRVNLELNAQIERMSRDAAAAQATIAQRDAQVAELTAALTDLLSAFVLHRTATHKTRPEYCETCQQGHAEIERASALLARTPAAPETTA